VTAETALGVARTMRVERGPRIVDSSTHYTDTPSYRSEVRHRCGFYD
jgi:hypothetical protein